MPLVAKDQRKDRSVYTKKRRKVRVQRGNTGEYGKGNDARQKSRGTRACQLNKLDGEDQHVWKRHEGKGTNSRPTGGTG